MGAEPLPAKIMCRCSLQKMLGEAVRSAVQPADATAAAVTKIFPAVTVGQVGTQNVLRRALLHSTCEKVASQIISISVGTGSAALTQFSCCMQDGSSGLTLRALSAEERQVLDQAARSMLAQMVASAVAAGSATMTWQLQPEASPAIPRLLDMMLLTSEQKFMDPG